MATIAADTFLTSLEKSELLSDEQLDQIRKLADKEPDGKRLAVYILKQGWLTKWQLERLLRGKSLYIGKYRLIKELGAGAMGKVYLAEHTQMRRRVALKTLSHREGQSSVSQFLEEARVIASMSHRNIIEAFDIDCEDDHYYLVMEYVEGEDLSRMVEDGTRLPYRTIADYIRQAAEGLSHAHEQGIVHRDIKPANLLVDKQGTVKILDMGVARLAETDDEDDDELGKFVGTVDYVSPEQAKGDAIDHRSDIYSLGCTLYFLLAGHPPFPEGSPAERLVAHQMKEPRSLLHERPDCPPGLAKICRKMMSKKPADRYASADEVVAALEKWLSEYKEPARQQTRRTAGASAGNGAARAKKDSSAPPPVRKPQQDAVEDEEEEAVDEAHEEEEEEPAASEFMIDTGGDDRLGRSTRPKTVKTEEATPAATEPKGHIMKNMWFIGGIVGAAVLLTITLVVILAGGGDDQPEAVAEADDAKQETEDDANRYVTTPKRDDDEHPGNGSETTSANGEGQNTDSAVASAGDPGSEAPENPDEGGTTEEPSDDGATKTTSPEDPPEDATKEPGDEPTSENPPKDPGAEPKDPETPKDPEEPKDPPKEDPPKDKPKDPPPPVEPFKGFPTAVSVPVVKEDDPESIPAEPTILGQVDLPEGANCFIHLLGGASASKGSAKFELERADGGSAKRDWVITFAESDADDDKLTVAKLALDGKDLKFQWTPEATKERDINYLRNCALNLRAADDKHVVALRQPDDAESLTLDFNATGGIRQQVEVNWVPDVDKLKVEITGFQGAFPPHNFKGGEGSLAADDGEKEVTFGAGMEALLGLQVTTRATSRRITLSVVPMANDGTKFVKFQLNGLAQYQQQGMVAKKQLMGLLEKTKNKDQKKQIQEQIDDIDRGMTRLTALGNLLQQIHEKGKMHYRVYMQVDTAEVEVASTGGPPAAAEAEAPAEAK